MKCNLLKYEKELYKNNISLIAGVDEAGRGPLAGPVVAAAVILPKNYKLDGLNDSKQLTEKKREEYFKVLEKEALSIGVGIISSQEIDEINILEASRKAMYVALNNLDLTPEYILSDAMSLNDIDIPSRPIIHGDALSLSIAAASVIAKVTRDHIMYEIDLKYPEYNFKKHKGYPTKEHLELLKKYGVMEEYRKSYKPVKQIMEELNCEENRESMAE
ncbi:MAG: ribonuclease HII [Bacilli bacterium]|jgi:ribonuclease HII|nr:ribonuclease HII [Bacilli bacterium]